MNRNRRDGNPATDAAEAAANAGKTASRRKSGSRWSRSIREFPVKGRQRAEITARESRHRVCVGRAIVKAVQTTARQRTTEDDITAEVLRRLDKTENARLRRIMLSLIQHLHHFVKDVELTEAEWLAGIQFLTDTGRMCSDNRQEFILLSDTLGVSMVVDLINHRKPEGGTESTVFGPFHRDESKGIPAIVSGRVVDVSGRPIAGALVGASHADSCRTDKEGRYLVRVPRPVAYQIPNDGPAGKLLRATGRHAWRPAHIHFVISADGFEPVTTHLFDSIDTYLESDAVFAVRESLVCTFAEHLTRDDAAKRLGVDPPFCTVEFDFVLKPKHSDRSVRLQPDKGER